MLSIEHLTATYGGPQVLHGISLEIHSGELVALIGPNGAGKTTLLRAISGLVKASGRVCFDGHDQLHLTPQQIVRSGIVHCPEGRQLFGDLTVEDNLLLGAHLRRDSDGVAEDLKDVLTLFPVLRELAHQRAAAMSGGEQQMLAIGRAIMSRPRMLMLDEPSFGLAPVVVERIFDAVRDLNAGGLTALLVEQNVQLALDIATRIYVLDAGRILLHGAPDELAQDASVRATYLGM
jgi:branched-chain amino acid transport system ATP-binding protein